MPHRSRINVFQESRNGVVEGLAHILHALFNAGVVLIGMHVPDKVRSDGYKSTTGLAQTTGHQQQFPERLCVVDIVVVVVPFPTNLVGANQWCGVITRYGVRILLRQVEGVGHSTHNRLEGLLLETTKTAQIALVSGSLDVVQLRQQAAPIIQPLARNR